MKVEKNCKRNFKNCILIKYFWMINSKMKQMAKHVLRASSLHPTEGMGGGQVFDIISLERILSLLPSWVITLKD